MLPKTNHRSHAAKNQSLLPCCHPMLLIASFFCWWPASLKLCFNGLAWSLLKSNGIWWDSWSFKTQIFSNPMESDGIHEVFKTQILSNPMETAGIHEVLRLKSCQIQWNLMGSMRYQLSNLIISKILWFRGRLFRVDTGKTLQGTYLPCGGEGGLINPMLAFMFNGQ